jgi:hypothetical protein
MRLLLLLCLVALIPDTDAQRRLSGRAGVVFATFADAGGLDQSPYVAPAAGLSVRFPVLRTFDAEIDLGVLPRGATASSDIGDERLRFSYFDLSLFGRAHIETRNRLRFAAYAGPTMSLLLQEALEDDLGQVRTDIDLSKGTHFAATVGALAGYRDVSLDVRFVRGLSTFVTDEALANDIVRNAYVHQALVISLGLRL